MNKIKNFPIVKIFIVAVLLIGVIFITQKYFENSDNFAKSIGALNTEQKLKSNINTFMESRVSEYDLGKENYYCSNFLYGYDDKYAYAWVYCSGFEIKNNDVLEQGTAFSIPTRLEYRQPNFQVIDFKQPGDGSLYDSTLRQLFPKKFYDKGQLPNEEINKLDIEVRSKAKAVIQIKAKYPELKDYPSDKLPPRSIVVEQEQNNLYAAFIQMGSGKPTILEARCFLVKLDNTIVEVEKTTTENTGKLTPNYVNNSLNFSAQECNSY